MQPKTIILALLAGVLLIAGAAAAEGDRSDNSTEPDDGEQAWVDDCPPDMMCAASDESSGESSGSEGSGDNLSYGDEDCAECSGMSDGNASEEDRVEPVEEPQDDEPTYSGDCGGEVCAYDGGSDPSEPVSSDNCMGGAQEGEECDDGKYYMTPPDDGRETAAPPEAQSGASDDAAAMNTPGIGAIAVLGVIGTVLALTAPRRRD